jgi:hypothetical protein
MARVAANRIAIFGDTPARGNPAIIDYNVPLPGAVKGRRLVLVNIQLAQNPWHPTVPQSGLDLAQLLSLTQIGAGNYSFDASAAARFFKATLAQDGIPLSHLRIVDEAETLLSKPSASLAAARPGEDIGSVLHTLIERAPTSYSASVRFPPALTARRSPTVAGGDRPEAVRPTPRPDGTLGGPILTRLEDFLSRLGRGNLVVPKLTWSGEVRLIPIPPVLPGNPRLFLIEEYQVSSRLGNYGLGRTVKTMSLLPGESVEINVETWRTDTSKSAYATSIFDSFSSEAASRFESEIAAENSNRTTDAVATNFGADFNTKGESIWASPRANRH